jgi:hypothetical protein
VGFAHTQCRRKKKHTAWGAVVCLQEFTVRDHAMDEGATVDLVVLLAVVFAGSLLGNLVYNLFIKKVKQ